MSFRTHDPNKLSKPPTAEPQDKGITEICSWCDAKAKYRSYTMNKWYCSMECQKDSMDSAMGTWDPFKRPTKP